MVCAVFDSPWRAGREAKFVSRITNDARLPSYLKALGIILIQHQIVLEHCSIRAHLVKCALLV